MVMTTEELEQALEGANIEISELQKQIKLLQFKVWQGEANQRVVDKMNYQRQAFWDMLDLVEKRLAGENSMVPTVKVVASLREQLSITEKLIQEEMERK